MARGNSQTGKKQKIFDEIVSEFADQFQYPVFGSPGVYFVQVMVP